MLARPISDVGNLAPLVRLGAAFMDSAQIANRFDRKPRELLIVGRRQPGHAPGAIELAPLYQPSVERPIAAEIPKIPPTLQRNHAPRIERRRSTGIGGCCRHFRLARAIPEPPSLFSACNVSSSAN